MKALVTQKLIIESYLHVIGIGYCDAQNLLLFRSPDYYTTSRKYGWRADIYVISGNTVIVTGYAPFGNIKPPYDIVRKYDEQARAIVTDWNMPQDIKREKISALLSAFIDEVSKG